MPEITVFPGQRLVVAMQYGSHIYGTDLPTSDVDLKAVFLPSAEEILSGQGRDNVTQSTKRDPGRRNTAADTDFERFSLRRFVHLALEGQTVAVDMLFTPMAFYRATPHPAWDELLQARPKLLHRGVAAMARYCQRQAAKYGIKGSRIATLRATLAFLDSLDEKKRLRDLETELEAFVASTSGAKLVTVAETHRTAPGLYLDIADRKVPLDAHVKLARKIYQKALNEYGDRALQAEKNEGVDWKALMHAVRVSAEAKELLLTGQITFPRPERALLRKIRKGELPYAEVAAQIEAGLEALDAAQAISTLPDAPDVAFAERFLLAHYRDVVVAGPTFRQED